MRNNSKNICVKNLSNGVFSWKKTLEFFANFGDYADENWYNSSKFVRDLGGEKWILRVYFSKK